MVIDCLKKFWEFLKLNNLKKNSKQSTRGSSTQKQLTQKLQTKIEILFNFYKQKKFATFFLTFQQKTLNLIEKLEYSEKAYRWMMKSLNNIHRKKIKYRSMLPKHISFFNIFYV